MMEAKGEVIPNGPDRRHIALDLVMPDISNELRRYGLPATVHTRSSGDWSTTLTTGPIG